MSTLLLLPDVITSTIAATQHAIAAAPDVVHHLAADIPDGKPDAPGDWNTKVGKIVGVAKWIGLALAVFAVIGAAVGLYRSNQGHGGEVQDRLVRIGFGIALVSGAATAVGFVVS